MFFEANPTKAIQGQQSIPGWPAGPWRVFEHGTGKETERPPKLQFTRCFMFIMVPPKSRPMASQNPTAH